MIQCILFSCMQACSFFNSNTVPLKISFVNADPFGESIDVIYKVPLLA